LNSEIKSKTTGEDPPVKERDEGREKVTTHESKLLLTVYI
jgi:hypothetical protein